MVVFWKKRSVHEFVTKFKTPQPVLSCGLETSSRHGALFMPANFTGSWVANAYNAQSCKNSANSGLAEKARICQSLRFYVRFIRCPEF